MQINGKHYSEQTISLIENMVQDEPDISRREISRRICRHMNWRSPNGQLQDMSCRKGLAELERRGIIELPKQEKNYGFEKRVSKDVEVNVANLSCQLSEVGEIEIIPVKSRYSKDSKAWVALMDKYHYLSSGPLCGRQIRYIVKSAEHGYLGALSFSSPSRQLKARDTYIGWDERARNENIGQIINNSRFLIVPTVKVKNLASRILSEVLGRVREDWQKRYKVCPLLVETYVDSSRFSGTIYKASNWQWAGKTSGRRDGIAKDIFVYPLSNRWKEGLNRQSCRQLGDKPLVENPSDWAEMEFGSVGFYDNRLKERLYKIARDFYNKPEASIPEACGSEAGAIGAYRFFQNDKVSMDVLLEAHTQASISRIKEHKVVLAPQDTTTLNYSTHPMTEGLGPIRNINDENLGLILHDTLAFSEDGTPLGVLDAQCWARDPGEEGKRYKRKELAIEEKESQKWLRSFQRVSQIQKLCPQTKIVSIGDRESDMHELFQEACKDPEGPKLLVRAERSRNRQVEQEQEGLWDYMLSKEVAGSLEIHLPQRGNKKARDVWVEVRFAQVELKQPKRVPAGPPVRIWAVYLVEQNPVDPEDIIEWMLLTTDQVSTFEDAKRQVEWYSGRWGIEVYHRTLKSGCRIRDRQLETADRLEAALGVDMVVAWRIYHMTMLSRETPDDPCTVFFKDVEWKALHCYVHKTPVAPSQPPTLEEAIMMVGRIGGHLGRKTDGMPGTQTLWRGLQRLDTATEIYVIFNNSPPPDT